MNRRIFPLCVCCLSLVLMGAVAVADDAPKAPEVLVSHPVQRDVTDYVDFPGRVEAVVRVELRARVSGYLLKTSFKEGHGVKQGDTLFEIDPRPYQAELDKAEAVSNLNKARLQSLAVEQQHSQQQARIGTAGAARELDKISGKLDEARAAVREAQAGVELAKLNLSFTRITSPCDGVIGRSLLSPGNLVKADTTLLGEIVTMDPMYVYFDMNEVTLLRLRRKVNEGKLKTSGKAPVLMALPGEDGFPHHGVLDYIGNEVHANTGTITMRGVFANPRPGNGVRLMTPGMFASIRLPIGEPHAALLVPDQAIGVNIGQAYLYVVDVDNKVQRRQVVRGLLQGDGLREIASGITAKDRIVVGGLKNVRPDTVVRPKLVAMPR